MAGVCKCDVPWTGADCSILDVLQSTILYPNQPQVATGASTDYSAAAWGGSIVRDEVGTYHLFSDVVCQDWSPGFHELNANIVHSTSRSPIGPWEYHGIVTGPSVDGFTAINPRIQRAPDGTYLLFHIAISSKNFNDRSRPDNCTGAAPITQEQRRHLRLRKPPTSHRSSYCSTSPKHDVFAFAANVSAAACNAECIKRNCSCFDWISQAAHHSAQCRVVDPAVRWDLAPSPDGEEAYTYGSPWGPLPPPGPQPAPTPDPGCGVNETLRVASSKSLYGPWELTFFKGNDSEYYPSGVVLPWPRRDNCNVNNPAGIVLLENGTLLMCLEVSIAHASGASQGTTIIASDSGSWRGPWRWVTPGRLPIGWPNGHEGNAEE
eukprot:SAG31_NODE_4539_length_3154_cov_17.499836_2_plen_377_part_00